MDCSLINADKQLYELVNYRQKPLLSGILQDYYDGILFQYYLQSVQRYEQIQNLQYI